MAKDNKKHLVLLDLYNHNNSIFNNILTMNPVCGCNIGCPYCYARKINQRFKHIPDFNKPQLKLNRLDNLKENRIYLMTSMSDFSSWCINNWKDKIFERLDLKNNIYLFLTKKPELCHIEKYDKRYWFGVSITCKSDLYKIEELRNNIKSNNYQITFEPLMEDLGKINLDKIGWVVIGKETGNRKGKIVPEKKWIENIYNQCAERKIPVSMKDKLSDILKPIQQFPEEFRNYI